VDPRDVLHIVYSQDWPDEPETWVVHRQDIPRVAALYGWPTQHHFCTTANVREATAGIPRDAPVLMLITPDKVESVGGEAGAGVGAAGGDGGPGPAAHYDTSALAYIEATFPFAFGCG
jgi:hypothetical protein